LPQRGSIGATVTEDVRRLHVGISDGTKGKGKEVNPMHVMMTYERVKIWLHSFLTSNPDKGER